MHPDLFTLPFGVEIKTYGFCLMIGFLTAVWFSMKRAARVNVDVDRVLDVSLVALIFGVLGARLFFVIHYWESQFADRPNKLLAIIDLRQGGLEFLGGFLGAFFGIIGYLVHKRQSLRLFMDILAPGVMWGVAIGRIGCYFNGCCFGGVCVHPETHEPRYPWAVSFPYGSPAQMRHWTDGLVTVPAELLITTDNDLFTAIVPPEQLRMKPERREGPRRAYELAKQAYDDAIKEGDNADLVAKLKAEMEASLARFNAHERELSPLRVAQQYPSRKAPERGMLVSEIEELAASSTSLPVHPAQLYSSASALLLCGLLTAVFYRRRRHGVVIGLVFLLYPVSRFLEEKIRGDNPHDVLGLTVSQALSVSMFLGGAIYLFVLYKYLSERSPRAAFAAPRTQTVEST